METGFIGHITYDDSKLYYTATITNHH